MEERPNYYAIIPANVRYDKNLRANEKLLYGEITCLTSKTGECWASNNYFAELYGVTPQAISRWVKNLEKAGYIETEIIYNGNAIEKRIIRLARVSTNVDRVSTNDLEGYQQNVKENNTSINNIKRERERENDNSEKRTRKSFTPPALEEVQNYIAEKKLNVDAKKFIDYFTVGNWIDSKGNKVKNWKQKILTWDNHSQKQEGSKKDKEIEWRLIE